MKRFVVFIILIFIVSPEAFTCICKRPTREKAVKDGLLNNNLIFLGEIIKRSDIDYTFKVIEIFKGKLNTNLVLGKSYDSCSMMPEYGLWIVYTNIIKDSLINLHICGSSISLDETNYNPTLPPIPDQKFTKEELQNKKSDDILYIQEKSKVDINNWIYHLEKLREYKMLNEEKSKTKFSIFENKIFQIGLIVMNFLLLTILFFRKKQ